MKLTNLFYYFSFIFAFIFDNRSICVQSLRRQYRLQKIEKIEKNQLDKTILNNAIKLGQNIRDQPLSNNKNMDELLQKTWNLLKKNKSTLEEIEQQEQQVQQAFQEYIGNTTDAKVKELFEKEFNLFIEFFSSVKAIYLDQEQLEKQLDESQKQIADDKNQDLLTSKAKEEIQIREQASVRIEYLEKFYELFEKYQLQLQPKFDDTVYLKKIIHALEVSIPPSFCWKPTSTYTAPKNCPQDYERSKDGLCQLNCNKAKEKIQKYKTLEFQKGELFFKGYCVEVCSQSQTGCKTLGPIIKTNDTWRSTRRRKFFIPLLQTNINTAAPAGQAAPNAPAASASICASDEERWSGTFCVKKNLNCDEFGYQKCGPLACSISGLECASKIANMVLSTIAGICKFVLFFFSPGAGTILSLIEGTMKDYFSDTQKGSSILSLITELTKSFVEQKSLFMFVNESPILSKKLLDDATIYMEKYLQEVKVVKTKEQIRDDLNKTLLQQYLNIVKEEEEKKELNIGIKERLKVFFNLKSHICPKQCQSERTTEVLKNTYKMFDFQKPWENLKTELSNCVKDLLKSTDKTETCINSITGLIASADPTGLFGIAKAFMYKQCDK